MSTAVVYRAATHQSPVGENLSWYSECFCLTLATQRVMFTIATAPVVAGFPRPPLPRILHA